MGIARQSHYDTFGDEHELYLKALRNYGIADVSAFASLAREARTPMEAIKALLLSVAAGDQDARARGCLGVQAICDFGTTDAAVSPISRDAAELFRKTLSKILADAKTQGDLPDRFDPQAGQKFFTRSYWV
ncbi:hypothetical protein EHI47_12065 [Rhizobium leguminosarum]|uniref:Uncharacterized protein n=1 Tax=Rhizobium leguminosarum TaxID=384 RepID=A0A444I2P1_RHILE|nr:hypothetical protein [Rhizobium leguminosarum]RWX31794.1 hypothetical protein EHI47_12065 [Rhizobium leguminosarum]